MSTVINKEAEEVLLQTLDSFKTEHHGKRVLHLLLSTHSPLLREAALQTIPSLSKDPDLRLFIGDDGDLYALGTGIGLTQAETLQKALQHFDSTFSSEHFALYDLSNIQHYQSISSLIEDKANATRAKKYSDLSEPLKPLDSNALKACINYDVAKNIEAYRKQHARPEIMVVEDDAFSRRLIKNVIGKDGNIITVNDARSAVSTYVYKAPHIMFLDIHLPDTTGHEVLSAILSIDPNAYVIMLSGNSDKENVLHAMNNGARGFVAKPFSREKLLHYIERCPTLHSNPLH